MIREFWLQVALQGFNYRTKITDREFHYNTVFNLPIVSNVLAGSEIERFYMQWLCMTLVLFTKNESFCTKVDNP